MKTCQLFKAAVLAQLSLDPADVCLSPSLEEMDGYYRIPFEGGYYRCCALEHPVDLLSRAVS